MGPHKITSLYTKEFSFMGLRFDFYLIKHKYFNAQVLEDIYWLSAHIYPSTSHFL